MATGASTADLAVILVDATKGLLPQTLRHSAIVALMGIRRIVLAVNKMDLVGYREDRFAAIVEGYAAMAEQLGLRDVTAIPVSALHGDNVIRPSAAMPWYRGPTLLGHLETVRAAPREDQPFRLAVQWINRDAGFRGYAGTVLGGSVRPGDEVVVLPSGVRARVERIVTYDGDLDRAVAGQAVTLTLDRRRRCRPRRRHRRRRRAAASSATSSPRTWCGSARRRCCRAGPICCGSAPRRRRRR